MITSNLDDIAAKLPKLVTGFRNKARPKIYDQPMQSRLAARKFVLRTSYITGAGTQISLFETTPIYSPAYGYQSQWKNIGNRWVSPEPNDIQKAIKSLERKAKCKLYYVLLIDTDGNYL